MNCAEVSLPVAPTICLGRDAERDVRARLGDDR